MSRMCGTLAVLISAAMLDIPICADDLPTGVANTQNPGDVSLTPQESLARITVPDGFRATLFAGEPDVRRPIAFDFDDRGRLWVVENYSHPHWNKDGASDRIVILADTDHDGTYDERKIFWDKGRYLTGLAIGHGGVWIANTPELSFIADRDHDDVPDAEPVVMLDGFQISTNNVLNNLHWGPDGWLYGAIGLSSTSLVGTPGAPKDQRTAITRGIWRFHPIDRVFEKVAEGMVNPWGADFNEFGDLLTSNTVLAHLWHIVPGMYCERRASEQDHPYAYGRIQSIANHLHWGGGQWQQSRNPSSRKKGGKAAQQQPRDDDHDEEYHQHSVAGGGHAHCGAMIYLGDNWPDKYRGTFFTNNLHGNRVNNDRLIPKRSTYVGAHSDDFLFGNDPWFRGMSIKYGSDGGVYISDWHDYGECHDSDGSHRTSGRIYKVVHGKPEAHSFDLQTKSNLELVRLHRHSNEWFVRHIRRILHERAAAGADVSDAAEHLWDTFRTDADERQKLKAIWTLYVTGNLNGVRCLELMQHDNEHVRRWGVRFLCDTARCDSSAINSKQRWLPHGPAQKLVAFAAAETSAKVRLEIACALQRLAPERRLAVAAGLLQHAEDARDPYLPLIIWYGVEPAVPANISTAIRLATDSKIPLVRRYIARRIADIPSLPLEEIVAAARDATDENVTFDLLQGMFESLDGRGSQQPPASWDVLSTRVAEAQDAELRSVGIRLSTIFGDAAVIRDLRRTVFDRDGDDAVRRTALRSLLSVDDGFPVDLLHRLVVNDPGLRRDALQALVEHSEASTAALLLEQYPQLSTAEKQAAIVVLATRQKSATELLNAISDGRISRNAVSAFTLQQLRSFSDSNIRSRIAELWANDGTGLRKSDEIARLKDLMTEEHLNHGSAVAGRLVFQQTCSKCHTLFGEGGTIAPDLTGSGRKKADYVLRNLIDPSDEIDAAYRLTTVLTADGRLFSGFMVQQDDTWLVIRTQDARIRLALKDVDELVTSNVSMMPEGMLRSFTDEQIRDLLVYLAGDDQVVLPEAGGGG